MKTGASDEAPFSISKDLCIAVEKTLFRISGLLVSDQRFTQR